MQKENERGSTKPYGQDVWVTFPVGGLDATQDSELRLGAALNAIDGVRETRLNRRDGTVTVRFDASRATPGLVKDAIEAAGFGAGPDRDRAV